MNKIILVICSCVSLICNIAADETRGLHIHRSQGWSVVIFSEVVINEELIKSLHPDHSIDEVVFGVDLEYVNFSVRDLRKISELYPNVKSVRFVSQNLCAEHLIFLTKLEKLENLTISSTPPALALGKPFAGFDTLGSVEGFILAQCKNLRKIAIKIPRDKHFESYLRDDQKLFVDEDGIPIEVRKGALPERNPEKVK